MKQNIPSLYTVMADILSKITVVILYSVLINGKPVYRAGTFPYSKCKQSVNDVLCEKLNITKANHEDESSFWPPGPYAIPILRNYGCPETASKGWKKGVIDIQSSSNGKDFKFTFCVKSRSHPKLDKGRWIPGIYSVYKAGEICPEGFAGIKRTWTINDKIGSVIYTGRVPDVEVYNKSGEISINFAMCEQNSTDDNISNTEFRMLQTEFLLRKKDNVTCKQFRGTFTNEVTLDGDREASYCFYMPDKIAVADQHRNIPQMMSDFTMTKGTVSDLVLDFLVSKGMVNRSENATVEKYTWYELDLGRTLSLAKIEILIPAYLQNHKDERDVITYKESHIRNLFIHCFYDNVKWTFMYLEAVACQEEATFNKSIFSLHMRRVRARFITLIFDETSGMKTVTSKQSVKLFLSGNPDSDLCNEDLGMADGTIKDLHISGSSWLPEYSPSAARPFGAGWCPIKTDSKPWILVDLQVVTVVEGLSIWLLTSRPTVTKEAMAGCSIDMYHGREIDSFTVYKETKFVVDISRPETEGQTFLFINALKARYIKLELSPCLSEEGRCLRFELQGCKISDIELLPTLIYPEGVFIANVEYIKEDTIISSIGYPFVESGQDYKWILRSPEQRFVRITFSNVSLSYFDENCYNRILISKEITTETTGKEIDHRFNKRDFVIETSESLVYLSFVSCLEQRSFAEGGFRALVSGEDIPACFSIDSGTFRTDGRIEVCDKPIMILTSMSILNLPYENIEEIWEIHGGKHQSLQLNVIDFYVVCPHGEISSKFAVVEFAKERLFCNTDRPPDVIYSQTSDVIVKFRTFEDPRKAALRTEGFRLQYSTINHSLEQLINTTRPGSKVCSKRFGKCYSIISSLTNWYNAKRSCWSQGAEIASVHSQYEMRFINYLLRDQSYNDSVKTNFNQHLHTLNSSFGHIGLKRQKNWRKKTFTWNDASPVTFSVWTPGNPADKGDCTRTNFRMFTDETWETEDCLNDIAQYVVCQSKLGDHGKETKDNIDNNCNNPALKNHTKVKVTYTGKTCQNWNSLTRNAQVDFRRRFPLLDIETEFSNNCQDPAAAGMFWCYPEEMDDKLWEPCFINPEVNRDQSDQNATGYLFQCDGNRQIPGVNRCDRTFNCWDFSDEVSCRDNAIWHYLFNSKETTFSKFKPGPNMQQYFLCGSEEWIHPLAKCDGIIDCLDASDETNCSRHNEDTDIIKIFQESRTALPDFKSHDLYEMGVRVVNTFTFSVKSPRDANILLQNEKADFSERVYWLLIGGWHGQKSFIEHAGDRKYLNRRGLLSYSEFRSFWISWNRNTIEVGKSDQIGTNVLLTYSGRIYDINYVSVGVTQSSYAFWKIPKGCADYEFTCYDGMCVHKSQLCDSHPDCTDAEDEFCVDCEDSFHCDGIKCIPRQNVCDNVQDCEDGSDEENCAIYSCDEWWDLGYRTSGHYMIGSMNVFCDYSEVTDSGGKMKISFYNIDVDLDTNKLYTGSSQDSSRSLLLNNPRLLDLISSSECFLQVKTKCPFSSMTSVALHQYYSDAWTDCQCTIDTFKVIYNSTRVKHEWKSLRWPDTAEYETEQFFLLFQSEHCGDSSDAFYVDDRILRKEIQTDITIGQITCNYDFRANGTDPMTACEGENKMIPTAMRCIYDIESSGFLKGCHSGSHLKNCDNFLCPENTVKCPDSYCIPVKFVCDGNIQCPGGQDEQECTCIWSFGEIFILVEDNEHTRESYTAAEKMAEQFYQSGSDVHLLRFKPTTLHELEQYVAGGLILEIKEEILISSETVGFQNCSYKSMARNLLGNIQLASNNLRAIVFIEDSSESSHIADLIWYFLASEPGFMNYRVSKNRKVSLNPHIQDSNQIIREVTVNRWSELFSIGYRKFPEICGDAIEVPCVGGYRCLSSKQCIQTEQICDGIAQCNGKDDEKFCYDICFDICTCFGYTINCRGQDIYHKDVLRMSWETRTADLSDNPNINRVLMKDYLRFPLMFKLNLSFCEIESIDESAFSFLKNLKWLDIGYNRIRQLSANAFSNLSHLEYLNLDSNLELSEISPTAFNGLKSLTNLSITNAKLKRISSFTFSNLTVKSINISYNEIEEIEDFAFSFLDNIEWIDIGYNRLKQLSSNVFSNLSHLEYLWLHGNVNLSKISPTSFSGLDSLRTFSITNAKLKRISSFTFSNLTVKSINISYNEIEEIEDYAFHFLNNLTSLDIGYNRIRQLSGNVFSNLSNVEYLNLDGNMELSEISSTALNGLNSVSSLRITNTKLRKISSFTFSKLTVRSINISYNEIEEIEDFAFSFLDNIEWIDIGYNRLKQLSSNVFSNLSHLEYLWLHGNVNLSKISPTSFSGLTSLRTFSITNAKLRTISSFTFSYLPLESINISYNEIEEIEDYAFHFLNNLTSLDIGYNRIRQLSGNVFSNLSNVEYLNLDGNMELSEISSTALNGLNSVSSLRITNTKLRKISSFTFSKLTVRSINISYNEIEEIEDFAFSFLNGLTSLDIGYNKIRQLSGNVFSNLSNLEYLNLDGNLELNEISPTAFHGLESLRYLHITHAKLRKISSFTFSYLTLEYINISYNEIEEIEDFAFSNISVEKIDFSGNDIKIFNKHIYSEVSALHELRTPAFKFCCIRPCYLNEDDCYPTKNEFSSCEDLMRHPILQSVLWLVGIAALLGNAGSIMYRLVYDRERLTIGYGIFVTNLAAADFLMGVYLILIAVVDSLYRKRYIFMDDQWRNSKWCTTAGVLSTVSSEASVLFLCLITLDRLLVIKYPFGHVRFGPKKAHISCVACWVIAFALALIPVIHTSYFQHNFYSRSGVCVALPLTRDKPPGWMYSVGIFVGLNFCTLILVAFGQLSIFLELRKATRGIKKTQQSRKRDLRVARNLILVATTDFMCWFPVGLMGIMALNGYPISGDVYAWTAVFILPLNSALNPILYTLTAILGKQSFTPSTGEQDRTEIQKEIGTGILKYQDLCQSVCIKRAGVPAGRSIHDVLTEDGHISIPTAIAISMELSKYMCLLHESSVGIDKLSERTTYIKIDQKKKRRVTIVLDSKISLTNDEKVLQDNIYQFGLLLRRLIANCKESQNKCRLKQHS